MNHPPRQDADHTRTTGSAAASAPDAVAAVAPGRRRVLRTALAASGWVALAAALVLPGGSPLRWVPVLAFVAFCPGLALLLPFAAAPRRPAPALSAPGHAPAPALSAPALSAPLSLSLAALTATALHLADAFSTVAFLGALALLTTGAAALPGRRRE
ncbi:hypothetical protein ACIGEZ_32755 [Streptomyces sp. NPDC085481]|uniref:hypothetical protein n=1 Tax=Streptomyces sp. NPDC085481 TaxID=3365727 RepID=UPI0037D1B6CF